jgi:hypothetical protein
MENQDTPGPETGKNRKRLGWIATAALVALAVAVVVVLGLGSFVTPQSG